MDNISVHHAQKDGNIKKHHIMSFDCIIA